MEKKRSFTHPFKRILSLALAFVMLLGMVPVTHAHAAEGDTTLYLEPNSNWLEADARFAVYYWDGTGNDGWADMYDNDGICVYEASIPAGYNNIIFCRMNPNTTENNWDNKWNQTSDLTVPTDGTNCYTVAEGTWDKGGGEWYFYGEESEEPSSEPTTEPIVTTTAPAVEEDLYIVAGDAALCGTNWDTSDTSNAMFLADDGTYFITYTNVAAGTYNLKVTDGTWDNSWGDNGQNYTFVVSAACDVTVTFDPATGTVSVTGDNVGKETGLDVTSMVAVGNGSGNWLNGANWDVASVANTMTETSNNIYEITFQSVSAGSYQFKFAANGDWTHNWGYGASYGEAVYNSQTNIPLTVDYALANVTLTLDLTGFDYASKNGATYSVTITEVTTEPEEPTVDYYLVGYINGADYGCEEDYENLGEYKFVDGKLTAKFDVDSYVFVKTGDNANWYMFESYTIGTTGTLAIGNRQKMLVPGGLKVEFTLTENEDGTLTLSYAEVVEVDTCDVTLHFFKTEGWGNTINAYLWTASGAVPGYSEYNAWPGKAVSANTQHPGWYDLVVSTEAPMAFNFIFNDGASQTADLYTGDVTGDTELWIVGSDVMSTAPGEWSGDYDYTAYLHFQKPEGWGETINAWIWDLNGASIPGYEQYHTAWPGSPVEADAINSGWYNIAVTMEENAGFCFIFNDGTKQTSDLSTGELAVKTHLWIVNGTVQTEAPAGWRDPSRTIHVPGTFPGPSWDASSNQMTWDAELGLYVYTFENVPPANYEYKISVNGSWNENYGAGGAKDGANMAVAVTETTDVTIYYNDETHNSVTSVSYIFADVTLSGTGIPTGTKLTDKGLSGIYSVTVPMTAGIYTDLVITCNGVEYAFAEIEIDEDKDVTFFLDPITEIFYCDASDIPVNTDAIYFDSQDEVYKQPFGAVATGEDVTFSIDTGADVTSAVLVVKGIGSYPMTAEETETGKRWSATTSFSAIGEYDYYFSLSNGSTVAIYSDDDGYYGEGQVTELTDVQPYDLVVYKAGFETPDWMKDAVIYQIFPDRFFDGDVSNNQAQTWARGEVNYEYITDWYTLPENPEQEALLDEATYKATGAHFGDGEWSNEIYGGDLEGITDRIDYLKALGVNVIYLNPIFWSISNHRYDAVDYTEIDPILGTMGDFRELVKVAEENGMHIILDGVFNHVSDDSVYFDRYYKFLPDAAEKYDGKIGAYPYWAYVYDLMAETNADKATAEAVAKEHFSANYGITDYSYTNWFAVSSKTMAGTVDHIGLRAGKEVYSYEGWWGYDSMPVIYSTNGSEYQTGNWAQEIIYNANETSVTQYWISQGNNGWRLDVANEVSDETWQRFRDSVKALDSDAVIIGEIWDDATKYLKGDMYDSVMNYLFRNAATSFAMGSDAAETMKELEKIRERYPEEAFYAMMNLVGSHDTTRLLSYLDGIGDDRNDKDLASAFPTYEGTSDYAKQMQHLVAFLQFTYAGAPTIYYGDEIGMVGSDDPDDRRAMEWGKGSKELVEWYAKLAAIRAAYPALRTGTVEPMELENTYDLLAFVRRDGSNTVTVIANNAFDTVDVQLEGTYVDLITGETFDGTVPACSGVILVAEDEVKTISVNYAGLAPAYDPAYTVAVRPHTHVYKLVITAPTCTTLGYTTYTCSICGHSYTGDAVPTLPHTETKVVTEPTCTEEGYTTYTCNLCGAERTDETVDALGHSYTYEDADGVRTYTCTVCGHSYENEVVLLTSGKSLTLKFIHPETKKTITGSKVNWVIEDIFAMNPYGYEGQDMSEYLEPIDPKYFSAYATIKNGKLTTYKNGDRVAILVTASLKADPEITASYCIELTPATTMLNAHVVDIVDDEYYDEPWANIGGSVFYYDNILDLNGRTEADGDCLIYTANSYPYNANLDVNWKVSGKAKIVEDEIYIDEYDAYIPVIKVYPLWNAKTGALMNGVATVTGTAADGSGKKVSFKVEMTSLPHSVEITMKDGKPVSEDVMIREGYYDEDTGECVEPPTYGMKVKPGKTYTFKANVDPNASANKKKVNWLIFQEGNSNLKISNGKITIPKDACNGDVIPIHVKTEFYWDAWDTIYLMVESEKTASDIFISKYFESEYDSDFRSLFGESTIDVSKVTAKEELPYGIYSARVYPEIQANQVVTWSLDKNSQKIATIVDDTQVCWYSDEDWEWHFGTIDEVPAEDSEGNPVMYYPVCILQPNWVDTKTGGYCKTGTVTLTATAPDGTKTSVKVKIENLINEIWIEAKDGREIEYNKSEDEEAGTVEYWGYTTATAGEKIQLKVATNKNAKSNKVDWGFEITRDDKTEYATISTSGMLTISKNIPSEGVWLPYIAADSVDGSYASAWLDVYVAPLTTNIHLRMNGGDGIMKYVSNTTKTWDVNDSMTLELSSLVYPFAASQDVKWTVSNKNIATIKDNEDGTATLNFTDKKFGKLTVTATAADGSKVKTSFTLNVVKSVQNIDWKEDAVQVVAAGKSLDLAKQINIAPSNATNKKLEWSIVSENTIGATLSKAGKLTTKTNKSDKIEELQILVKALDGFEAEQTLTVLVYPVQTKSVTVSASKGGEALTGKQTLPMGSSLTVWASSNPLEGTAGVYTCKTNSAKVATVVDNGDGSFTITANAKGSATITITSADGTNKSAKVSVSVVEP